MSSCDVEEPGVSQASSLIPSTEFSAPSPDWPEPGLLWPLLNQNMGSGVTDSHFSDLVVGI